MTLPCSPSGACCQVVVIPQGIPPGWLLRDQGRRRLELRSGSQSTQCLEEQLPGTCTV